MPYKAAIRIVNVDFYMSPPVQDLDVMYADFRGCSITQVPVIRIFGSTNTGKKICLHVHGVFPYLYIPYDGIEDANRLKYQIAANIDKAINISFGQGNSTAQHVYKIVLVTGIPFYGYHTREHQFFKIFLFNPALVRKVSNMLQSKVILGRSYQPHESHIPYILQFMIDYNLHGMSRILLTDLKYRDNTSNGVPKQTTCEAEADALSENILNRFELAEGKLNSNPGIAALWEDERQRLRDKNEDSQLGPCLTLDNSQVEPTKTHKIFKCALAEKLYISDDTPQSLDQSICVYPAETPHSTKLQNASFIETHSSQKSNNSFNENLDLNCTFDEDAQNLFEILQDLGIKNPEIEESDCVLSQIHKEEEEEHEEEIDLSMSIAETTPFKHILDSLKDVDTIPQLDGQTDGSDEDNEVSKNKASQNSKSAVKYRALPIFVSSPAVNKSQELLSEKGLESLANVKRKLAFHNSTFCEDTLDCKYKGKTKVHLCAVEGSSKRGKIKKNDSLETDISKNYKTNTRTSNCEEAHTPESLNQKKIEEFSLGEKLVPSSEKKTQEFSSTENPGPTAAELYDFQTNYKAKEGCSSKFTQDSTHQDLKLSLESSSDMFYTDPSTQTSVDCNKSELSPLSSLNPTITPLFHAPTRAEVLESLESLHISQVNNEKPFYSDVNDVTGSVEIGHNVLRISSNTTVHLEECKTTFDGLDAYRKTRMPLNVKWTYENAKKIKLSFCRGASCVIQPVKCPPTVKVVEMWLLSKNEPRKAETNKDNIKKIVIPRSPGRNDDEDDDLELTLTQSLCEEYKSECSTSPVSKKNKRKENSCQITGTTLDNTYGFKTTPENYQNAKVVNEFQFLTILSIEIHVQTRGDLKPDPAYDSVNAIFYSVVEDGPSHDTRTGVVGINLKTGEENCEVTCVETEEELFAEFVKLVQEWDPDLLIGYETEMLSWGFLLERSEILEKPLLVSLSRVKDKSRGFSDEGLKITGRILLDVWRLLRHEVALQSYTFENIVYHLLHKRIPLYPCRVLANWWNNPLFRHRTVHYYLFRAKGTLQILEQLDLIGRTSELARLFGIQFFEVLSRGSQFRVESMMLRLAKPMNYIPVSPSVQQRAKMKAPEFLPLILEPESKFYVDPVIVLDFQSLYPSMMIAYNYCFSTCLGKVTHLSKNTPFEFGATQLKVSRSRVKKLLDEDSVIFSPCGVAFVKRQVRDGILPRMLREILETRLMVKNSMKKNKEDKVLQKVLHNRQLGLKLIANVTYGYTAANFSGRMPAVELADSVVSKGRETLQRAIEMVDNTPEWKARVVYGDTDSLFVMVPGRSRQEAFQIGTKIADAVTAANPDPVKLKLEKVYLPCILQTKKRYVGYMYEGPEQKEPLYLAKGIETVRRDGCPAVSKMLEKCLKLLFETKDVSLVKKYVLRQFHKIMTGRISLQDLTFAKEYRGASGYRPGACVPALELARKWTAVDRRNEPRRAERVPYVIVSGPPGVPLIRLVRSPREFLSDPSLRPNVIYYITKVIIPPINRCFNLIGADLHMWFNQMPRKQFQYLRNTSPVKKSTISQYFVSHSCAVCGEQTQRSLCDKCRKRQQRTLVVLHEKLRVWERSFCDIQMVSQKLDPFICDFHYKICQSCTGVIDDTVCISLDCPVLYRLGQTSRDLEQSSHVRQVISSLDCEPESTSNY